MRKIGKELKGGVNWIGPTTLLTRFAKELRRAPAAGDFEFRIGEGIAHAKDAKGDWILGIGDWGVKGIKGLGG